MTTARTTLAIALACCTLAPVPGCKEKAPTNQTTSPQSAEPVFRRYTVRAVIETVDGTLRARHEAIPDFDGGSYGPGMNTMSMDFWPPVGPTDTAPDAERIPEDLDLSGFSVGDKVEITFEVQHAGEGADPGVYYALAIEPLPADTELDFDAQLPKTVTFETRGQVVALPSMTEDFKVRHEVVPDFPNPDGSMGMNTMTMPFWPATSNANFDPHRERIPADLDLEGIEVGDKVMITWEYQRDRATNQPISWYAVKVEKLPDDTELDFTPMQR
jgi:hypothetical protein